MAMWPIVSTATAAVIVPASSRMPMARSTSTSRRPPRTGTSRTGYRRHQATSYCGCVSMSPMPPFSMARTRCRRSSRQSNMAMEHLFIFGAVCITTWLLVIYFWPRMMLYVYKRALLVKGFGDGPVPTNTLYTQPQALFADPLHVSLPPGSSNLMSYGTNRDTLYVCGWLDLRTAPLILRVPDMAGRYYSVQFTDPAKNVNFAYVGKRTTGTEAGDFLISGPGWKEAVQRGVTQISSPNNS